MSRELEYPGPVSTGSPKDAGSSKLCPPTPPTRLPPTKATSAAAYSDARSPTVSTNTTCAERSGMTPLLQRVKRQP